MKNKKNIIIAILSVFVLIGCKDKQSYSKMNDVKSTSNSDTHKIVINEFINAAGYTYINVNENEESYWMAIPNTAVKKGETYFYSGGMKMKNFESKELKRTFDNIIFVEGVSTTEELVVTPKMKNPHESDQEKQTVADIHIKKPENGISISELYEGKSSFKDKEVIVRGKVVKVNKGILDRNWIHIVDGTSFDSKSDLTITTDKLVKVGDTVTFKAVVTLDKDFGYGYVYNLLLEKGELIK